ncbi:hypothetical protein CSUI_004292 [Cystoisospora suis]|uniref:Uncharacterized protein n=1 Tax=Cystoisospora suis TaxID=483139 RepID=A0A2C6KC88_9APIC|nr:hypothetical protein CSUI_004292 [Cystoisospora suis]
MKCTRRHRERDTRMTNERDVSLETTDFSSFSFASFLLRLLYFRLEKKKARCANLDENGKHQNLQGDRRRRRKGRRIASKRTR